VLPVVVVALLLSAGTGLAQNAYLSAGAGGHGFTDLLSRPLPGTPERADADAARALEAALADFSGVTAAHVIITRATDADALAARRRAAVHLTVVDEHTPTPAWVEGIAAFVTEAVPDLAPEHLTIVAADGTVFYARGSAAPAVSPPAGRTGGALVGWAAAPVAAALGGCALVVAAVLAIGRRREPPRALADAEREPGPFAFLTELSDEELRLVLADERPEVLGLVAGAVEQAQADRVRAAAARDVPSVSPEAADAEVVAALAAALRGKLVSP